jgi:BolA protein
MDTKSQQKISQIEQSLKKAIQIQFLKIEDESVLHKDHAEAIRTGKGHFALIIVSDDFTGKSLPERHRMVYSALNTEIKSFIHALSIKAATTDEYQTTP